MNLNNVLILVTALFTGYAFGAAGMADKTGGAGTVNLNKQASKSQKATKKRKAAVRKRANKAATTEDGTSTAANVELYKKELAQRIAQVNSTNVYTVRPQALLRSVVVVRFVVDANGSLVSSEIERSNHDRSTEATALASLRSSAPFPKPAANLLRGGRLELYETWLFNNDGRFQIRSIAQQQIDR
jgi:protein TonB